MWSIFTYIKDWIIKFFKGANLGLVGIQAYYYYPHLIIFPFVYGLFTAILFLLVFSIVLISYKLILYFGSLAMSYETVMKILAFSGCVVGIYLALFAYVLLNVGICYATAACCEDKKLGLLSAVRMGLSKWKIIAPWSALIMLVKSLSGKKEEGASTAGTSFWQFITGTAWYLLTFSVYPVMAFENLSLFQTLKKSVRITTDNFGTISGIRFSIGVLNEFILCAAIGVALGGFGIIRFFAETYIPESSNVLMLSALATAGIYFLFVVCEAIAFMGMAETIISTIVYRHIHNQSTGVFTREQLEAIIKNTELV